MHKKEDISLSYLGRPEPGRPEGRRDGGGVGLVRRRRAVDVAARATLELLLVALEQLPHLGGLCRAGNMICPLI